MKNKLDAILKAFGDYICGQYFFDIVYFKKVGYVRILDSYIKAYPENGAKRRWQYGE